MTPLHARAEHLGLRPKTLFKHVRPDTRTQAWIISFVTTISSFLFSTRSFALEPVPPRGTEKIKSGFALMAGGLVTVGVGAAIYVANENAGKTTCTACARNSWVLPTVLMTLGGAMFATGGTLLTIGLVQRSDSTAPTATLSVSPFGASARLTF